MIEVTDMYLVAVLIACGADYVGVDRIDKKNQRFAFSEPLGVKNIYTLRQGEVKTIENPAFKDIKLAYDTVVLLYPPNYVDALRRVKGIIHT